MCSKHRGKKQDERTACAVKDRELLRKETEMRREAREIGMSYEEYLECVMN